MLNPPLSLLSFDLLEYIVEFVAPSKRDLRNLSLADRAFTQLCQNHIFRTLGLGYCSDTKKQLKKELRKIKKILIQRVASQGQVTDQNPPTALKCRIRPSILHLEFPLAMEDPILVVDRLRQTFFSETLTTLHLSACQEMPLAIFLTCRRLKEVVLKDVTALDDGYDDFPARQCSDYTSPALEKFQYRASHTLVEQMILPPPIFPMPVVLWSSLRVLELSPFEKHEMACLQAIVSAASGTLEELYFTQPRTVTRGYYQLWPLREYLDLSGTIYFRAFALAAIIEPETKTPDILHDISLVLGTIAGLNLMKSLSFSLTVFEREPVQDILDQDWDAFCQEVVRISSGKPLVFDLNIDFGVYPGLNETTLIQQSILSLRIAEEMDVLRSTPNILFHMADPTFWPAELYGDGESD